MNSPAISFNWTALLSSVLGLAAALAVGAHLAGWKVPFIATDRTAFYALAVLGFGMCTLSMGQTTTHLGWTHPITIAGVVLGVLIVLLVVVVLAGRQPLWIANDRVALLILTVAVIVKWGLGVYSRMVLKV
jgi:uncharacterized membrane protein YccC